MNEFYERVKTLTKSQNKSLRELIESCGINYDSYNSYKRYDNLPRADEAVAIANTLGTTVEYLVTGKDPLNSKEIIRNYLVGLVENL